MKTALFFFALLLSSMLAAQTIDHPTFKVRTGSISNITRIERTPEVTKLFIHAIFRPHWWIMQDDNSYLVDIATGVKYPLIKAEGIELKKKTFMPDSGEKNYILHFAPLPATTTSIHWLNPTDLESNTYDIVLVATHKAKKNPLENVKGNWYKADNSNNWEYGIYDSISIIRNRIFTNHNIYRKGKRIEMTVKDKQNGNAATLLLTPQKNGNLLISLNGETKQTYTRQKSNSPTIATEDDFTKFFCKDTAYLQGYINGYDPRLNFETGTVYLKNILTREDFPTVIEIHPDGTFEGKLALNHPAEIALELNTYWIPFYIEPGQTLTMYIEWESILEYSRARNYNLAIKNIEYMGPSAALSRMKQSARQIFNYPYEKLHNAQKTLTPNEFKESLQPVFAQWDQAGDSLMQVYAPSAKAIHLLKNKIAIAKGYTLFDYLMSRDYYAKQDTANLALKIQEDNSYYDFLKQIPLNDEVLLADYFSDIFINRFEYMSPLSHRDTQEQDSVTILHPTKPLLTFLKEKGIKLTSEQEKIRIKQEKLAGKIVKEAINDLEEEYKVTSHTYQTEKELVEEYKKLHPINKKASEEEEERNRFDYNKDKFVQKDAVVKQLSGKANSFLLQTAMVRSLGYELKEYKTRKWAEAHINELNKHLTYPILATEAQQVLNNIHPKQLIAKSYQLPQGKATDIFRNIIKAHAGKILFVDFWATSCGPCRSGIKATAQLRAEYKNHPEFQFIYITSEKESPKAAYDAFVENNLKGEASYRVSETEFNYLRELFKFNGIPHYEMVEKDGSISSNCPNTHALTEVLKQRLSK